MKDNTIQNAQFQFFQLIIDIMEPIYNGETKQARAKAFAELTRTWFGLSTDEQRRFMMLSGVSAAMESASAEEQENIVIWAEQVQVSEVVQ